MCSIQIDARKEQLSLAKSELKQAKKEAKIKGSSDTKMQTYVLQERVSCRNHTNTGVKNGVYLNNDNM